MDLGGLLTLMHESRERVGTFYGEFTVASAKLESPTISINGKGQGPSSSMLLTSEGRDALRHTLKLWRAKPGCLKMETWEGEQLTRASVMREGRWSLWDATDGAHSGVCGRHDPPDQLPPILDPALFISMMAVTYAGTGEHLGRPTYRAIGQARGHRANALTYELECDREYGTVLRREGCRDGARVLLVEAVVASFDTPMQPGAFQDAAPLLADRQPE